ncbi:MAG: serine hydrolase [Sphingopyxis granuli]|uniref:serine hydrolase domain-containing protein n=1 Tax=Sphingopyxis granuli TaxID=267128 RepID=UPI003C719E5A
MTMVFGGQRMGKTSRNRAPASVRDPDAMCRVLLALAVAALPLPTQAAETNVELNRAWAAGYRAAFTCSSLWNGAGKTLADIERDELTHIYPEIEADVRATRAEIDTKAKRVTVRYRDDMPPRVAEWTGRDGCVMLPIGVEPGAGALLHDTRPNFDAQPWPLGDRDARVADREARFSAVAADKARFGGRTSSLLIVKDGRIALEWYQPGHGVHTAQRTFSVAKSIAATLIGHAVERGQFDVKAPAGIAEWRTAGDPRAAITTEQLLRMASGLTSDSAGNRTDAIYMGGASVRQWTTQWPLLNPPGTRYRYANNDTLLAVLSLKAALEEVGESFDPAAFLDRIGMTRTFVERDKDGDAILSSQVSTTARDLARLGLLYQDDGMWRGERLLPADWRHFVTARAGPQPDGPFGYGAGFWLLDASEGIPADAFGAFGNRGQYMVVIPSRRLVIVRQGYDDAAERLDIAALVRAVVAADGS